MGAVDNEAVVLVVELCLRAELTPEVLGWVCKRNQFI